MKKFPVILLFLLLSTRLFAQHLSGTVIDADTRLPLSYATVNTGRAIAFTGDDGKFTLTSVEPGDTVRITSVGYKSFTFTVYKINDTVNIYLDRTTIQLNNVNINGARNYKADSLRLRQEYAAQFGYRKPKLKDYLKTNLPNYVSNDYGTGTNNGTAIGGLDLLSVINFFGRNKTPAAKMQKELEQDEQDNYIDHIFSKARVTRLTSLKGDSLQAFMRLYRPTITQVKTMTDYEMLQYIKTSYAQFMVLYDPAEEKRDSIFKKPE